MYNLDEQFSKLSTKQLTNMVRLRIKKDSVCMEDKHSLKIKKENCSCDVRYDLLQNKVSKIEKTQDDISEWMDAAKVLFSKNLWSEIVEFHQCWDYE